MVEIDSSFEDDEKPDQTKRKLEEVHQDPENCGTENEDPNFPVQKAVQSGKKKKQTQICQIQDFLPKLPGVVHK